MLPGYAVYNTAGILSTSRLKRCYTCCQFLSHLILVARRKEIEICNFQSHIECAIPALEQFNGIFTRSSHLF